MTLAMPQTRGSKERAVTNVTSQDLRAVRVLFFCGDVITDIEKHDSPEFMGFGGIFLPHIHTLKPETKGMLYRCRLTPLRPKMKAEPRNMLFPKDVENMAKSFVATNAKQNAQGEWVDETVGAFGSAEDYKPRSLEFKTYATRLGLVYDEILPGVEVTSATRRNLPNGIGGIVDVTALQGASDEQIREAQLYFFPDWEDIEAGIKSLPETIAALLHHIDNRIDAIRSERPDKVQVLSKIGQAMRTSCVEYQLHGEAILNFYEDALQEAKDSKVFGIRYPVTGDLLLKQLGQRRKADVIAGDASAVNTLANVMLSDREDKKVNDARQLDLDERKLLLAEVQAGIRNPDGSLKTATSGYLSTDLTPFNPVLTTTNHTSDISYVQHDAPEEVARTITATESTTSTAQMQQLKDFGAVSNFTATGGQEIVEYPEATLVGFCGQPTANGVCKRELKNGEPTCWQHK